jgi:hypothetical protein
MRTFKDSSGRSWELAITIGTVMRIKDALGIDLLMPDKYNIAKRLVEAEVADDPDYDTIEKYEALFKLYQEQLKPQMKLNDLMKSEFYKSLDTELKSVLVNWYRLKV